MYPFSFRTFKLYCTPSFVKLTLSANSLRVILLFFFINKSIFFCLLVRVVFGVVDEFFSTLTNGISVLKISPSISFGIPLEYAFLLFLCI